VSKQRNTKPPAETPNEQQTKRPTLKSKVLFENQLVFSC